MHMHETLHVTLLTSLPRPLQAGAREPQGGCGAAADEDQRAALQQLHDDWLCLGACFLVGSVLYLPTIGCTEHTVRCGTWLFVVGSCLFVWAGVLPIVNTRLRAANEAAPPFETVVHGTVRLKRARPTFQALGRAVHAANRFNSSLKSPFKSPLPLNFPEKNDSAGDSPPAE